MWSVRDRGSSFIFVLFFAFATTIILHALLSIYIYVTGTVIVFFLFISVLSIGKIQFYMVHKYEDFNYLRYWLFH